MNTNAMEQPVVIVGAGFYGAVMAERFASAGRRVLVLDKRPHVGGNSWSRPDPDTGVEEHVYGPHIFHTSDETVWEYANRFTTFNGYRHTVWARRRGKIYPLPFGLAAINLLLGRSMGPAEARAWVEGEVAREGISEPRNLEEKALSLVGRTLYDAFVKEYTEKHWGRPATELPAYIITRLPLRWTFDTNYYSSRRQGIPTDGYGAWFRRMLAHPNIELRLSTDYFDVRGTLPAGAPLIYTGPIDRFFGYKHGRLGWRSVRWEKEVKDTPDWQGTSVINECDGSVPCTRVYEYAHFTPERRFERTIVHREYSFAPGPDDDTFYPVGTPEDAAILAKYRAEAAATCPGTVFGGRLGRYSYWDMDKAIAVALADYQKLASGAPGGIRE
ncbi:MAG: NAD(P)-binding protein [Kiritimatiellae bacterium]|nr:NAD(P)-binding protein [Kiritimatiellia bacterium]